MSRRWTYTEEMLLVENYSSHTIKELCELIPSKNEESINAKIKRLKASGKITKPKEEDAIKRAYSQRNPKQEG